MRKNQKRQAHAKVLPAPLTGVIVLVATLVLVYCVVDSKCAQLGHEIRKCEQKLMSLEDERVREEARWNEKNTPEKLAEAMMLHGIAMARPAADQMVRMDAAGQPLPGQPALAKFKRARLATEEMVKTQPE